MKFEKLQKTLKSTGTELKDVNGRSRNLHQFQKVCKDYDIKLDLNNVDKEYELCIQELLELSFKTHREKTPYEIILEKLNPLELFKDFEICEDNTDNYIIQYTNPLTKNKKAMCTILDYDARLLSSWLSSNGVPTLDQWQEALKPYKSALKLKTITAESSVNTILELCGKTDFIKRRPYDFRAATVALEGTNTKADHIIPFTKKHSTLGDLNPVLNSFLERTTDHKYLCAIIASRLLNFKHSYTPYLYGGGGDGKSTFISFLNMLVKGQTSNLRPETSNFGLYNCVGKVFLMVNDTNTKHVFSFENIKQISGYDKVSVESKYKNAKDLYLPGMIIITSNRMPEIYNEVWFKRRARIFPVSSLNKTKEGKGVLDATTAAEEMYKTANEFINYCLQCLEELGNINTGEVPIHPYLIDLFKNTVSSQELAQRDFLKKLGYTVDPTLTSVGYTLRGKVESRANEDRKDSYFVQNFMDFLERKNGVYLLDDTYYGIGIPSKDPGNTTFNPIKLIS